MEQPVPNPFDHDTPIRDVTRFFGREKEVAGLMQALAKPSSRSILGERRVGKTSLLRYASHPQVMERYDLVDPARHIVLYFDFLGHPAISPDRFWRFVLKHVADNLGETYELASRARLMSEQGVPLDFIEIEEFLADMSEAGLRLLLFFDEFEYAAANPNLTLEFFGALRTLASNYDVAFVIASQKKLIELTYHHRDVVGSPFFNIFKEVRLGFFDEESAHELIARSLDNTGVTFDAEDRALVERLSGYHPYFLQLACYYLFQAYTVEGLGQAKAQRHRYVERAFATEADKHFRYYWEESRRNGDEGEQIVLATLAIWERSDAELRRRIRIKDFVDPYKLYHLEERALVFERAEAPCIFSAAFTDWIHDRVTHLPGEEEAITLEEWVAENIDLREERLTEVWEKIGARVSRVNWGAVLRWFAEAQNIELLNKLMSKVFQLTRGVPGM